MATDKALLAMLQGLLNDETDGSEEQFLLAELARRFLLNGITIAANGEISLGAITINQVEHANTANFSAESGDSLLLGGKAEGDLNVNSAVSAASAATAESANTANTADTANNSLHLGGQLPAHYTNASNLDAGTVPLARLSAANSTANGVVTTDAQTLAGDKTFANTVTAGLLVLPVGEDLYAEDE